MVTPHERQVLQHHVVTLYRYPFPVVARFSHHKRGEKWADTKSITKTKTEECYDDINRLHQSKDGFRDDPVRCATVFVTAFRCREADAT